jgi:hypothetical protein
VLKPRVELSLLGSHRSLNVEKFKTARIPALHTGETTYRVSRPADLHGAVDFPDEVDESSPLGAIDTYRAIQCFYLPLKLLNVCAGKHWAIAP